MRKIFAQLYKSVFTRVMLIFFIAMLPVVSLGYYVYSYGSNLTVNEIARSLMLKSGYVIETLEKEVERINYLLYKCMEDKDLNDIANLPDMDPFEKHIAVQRMTQRIQTIKDSSRLLQDINIGILALGFNVSAENGISHIAESEYNTLWNTQKQTGAGIILYNNTYHIITHPIFYDKGALQQPSFIIDATLSREAITDIIRQTAEQSNAEICFTDRHKQMFFYYGGGNTEIFDEYIDPVSLESGSKSSFAFNKVLGKKVNTCYIYSEYFDMALLQIVTDNVYLSNLTAYRWILILLTAITVLMIALFSAMIYRTIQKPIVVLLHAIERVENGDFHNRITYRCSNELQFLINGFNHMMDSLDTLVGKVYKQEILTKRAELKQLQTQIDPHFLFNSFFMLKTMLKCGRMEEADRFIQYLGEYYQYVTRNKSDYASLNDEIQHAKAYSSIQMMRFQRSFTVEFGPVADDLGERSVPRLILQPFIENTIEHGIKKSRRKTNVRVAFEKVRQGLIIRIADTGGTLDAQEIERMNAMLREDGNTSAVVNIHHRLQIMYGAKSGVYFQPNATEGLTVVINIFFEDENHISQGDGVDCLIC